MYNYTYKFWNVYKMIKIGIVGAAGYSGLELIKLLLNHPEAEIGKLFGYTSAGNKIDEIHPSLRGMISLKIEKFSVSAIDGLDIIFVALPSGQAMDIVSQAFTAKIKVIDLGGDFRLKNVNEYLKYYKHEHTAKELLNQSVYGLSEWNEAEIKNAKLVANPGCYPTSILLGLLPLLKDNLIEENFISITSYSGTSGAGKSITANMMFSEVNESVRAYKVGEHQHIPEINHYLKVFSNKNVSFTFVPHLLPATRGIYTTIHAKVKDGISNEMIIHSFKNKYATASFIRFYENNIPEMKNVQYTNFCDIGFKLYDDNLIIISTIDNLIKGAAGQAIQNMNIMFSLPQEIGLLKCNKNMQPKLI